ncbi:D-ribose-binding periplasmic protein precursor [compost metagenome]
MRKGFEEEIEKINKAHSNKIKLQTFVAGEGKHGVLNQIHQLNQVLKSKPSAIVIQPTDNSALALGLLEANLKGIPVIAYDQYIVNGHLTSYVTSDNYRAGQDNAEFINTLYEKGKSLKIVVFEYAKVSSTMDRVDGFFDTLREKERAFRVLKKYEAVDPESGALAAKKFLKDFPRKYSVDLILTVNDGGGLPIVKALWDKKRHEIRHVTFDGDPASIKNLEAKKLTVIDSAQFCAELGRVSARTLSDLLQNKVVAAKKLVPTFPVTRNNISQYPGWMGVPSPEMELQTTTNGKAAQLHVVPNISVKSGRLVLRIGIAPLCPYLCQKAPGRWSGYLYDILMDVAQENDFTLQIEGIPNTRLITNLPSQRIQYAIIPSYLVRYRSDIRISGPRLGITYSGALVPSKAPPTLIDEKYLSTRRVIYADIGDDTLLDGFFEHATKITGSDVSDRMLRMMGDGRIELAIGDYNVLNYAKARKPGIPLKVVPTSLTGFNSLVLVSLPRNAEMDILSPSLERWIANSRRNGKLDAILKKYNLSDWQIFLPY